MSVAVNPNTNTIHVANQDSNTISVINGTTHSLVAHITVGNFPTSVAVNPNTNTTDVANSGDNTLSTIAPTTTQVLPSANNSIITLVRAAKGISLYQSGDYVGAIAMFDKCLSINPN
jgi:YVTN family beta-propeller protein